MEIKDDQELRTLVTSLEGLRGWYVSCGGAAGPTFQLALGKKVPRQAPLRNPAHSEEYRRFEGEANLLVWCTWRLDGPDGPLTSSDDTSEAITTNLGHLIGAMASGVVLAPPAWDLSIRFSNDLYLHIFCDHVPGDPSFDGNWELWRSNVVVAVGPGARYVIEARNSLGNRAPTEERSLVDGSPGGS